MAGLPKSPATGTTTIGTNDGKLETQLLVASTFRAAASAIAKDPRLKSATGGKILLLPGDSAVETPRLLAFHSHAYALEKSFERANLIGPSNCDDKAVVNSLAGVIGPLSTALVDLLKTDIDISGIDSTLTAASLMRAVAVAKPDTFTTTLGQMHDIDEGEVAKTLCRLEAHRAAASTEIDSATDEQKKQNPRRYALLSSIVSSYDTFFDGLWKNDGDKPSRLALVLMEERIKEYPDRILRIWVDASGGTVIKRKSLWTMVGARSVGMTGGSVVSYLLTETASGDVVSAGFLHCNTQLVSLRTAHKDAFARAYCEPLTDAP